MSENMRKCPKCGYEMERTLKVCPNCGAKFIKKKTNINNSGEGPQSKVLDIVAKKFNWGAFWFNWIWCLVYGKYLFTVIYIVAMFIPLVNAFISLGLSIYFGIKGNTWAWQSRQYQSVQEFHKIHKRWALVTTLFSLFMIACTVFFFFTGIIWGLLSNSAPLNDIKQSNSGSGSGFASLMSATEKERNRFGVMSAYSTINLAFNSLYIAGKEPQNLSAEGLANYVLPVTPNSEKIAPDTLKTQDGVVYKFVSDNSCETNGCYIHVDVNGDNGPNKEWINSQEIGDIVIIPIKKQNNSLTLEAPELLKKYYK